MNIVPIINTPPVSGFDYSVLEATIADTVRSTAERINTLGRETILDIGRELLKVKALLDHGKFGPWLSAEFGGTERTAQNYMQAADLVGEYEIVSHLPPTAIYKLASPSVPDGARTEIVGRLVKGDTVSTRDISDTIAPAKWKKAEANRLAKIPPAKLARIRRSKEQREREREAQRLERQREEQGELHAAQQAIGILRDRLAGDAFKEFAELVDKSGFCFADELRKALKSVATS